MNSNEFHLHIHEGATPEAVRTAVETYNSGRVPDTGVAIPETEPGEDGPPADSLTDEAMTALAVRAYAESEGNAKPLLEYLAEHPDRLVSYTEASEALGFPSKQSMPGLLGSFGKRANHRYGGIWPFDKGIWANGDSNFLMTEVAASAIRGAHRE